MPSWGIKNEKKNVGGGGKRKMANTERKRVVTQEWNQPNSMNRYTVVRGENDLTFPHRGKRDKKYIVGGE